MRLASRRNRLHRLTEALAKTMMPMGDDDDDGGDDDGGDDDDDVSARRYQTAKPKIKL